MRASNLLNEAIPDASISNMNRLTAVPLRDSLEDGAISLVPVVRCGDT
jgi:hypothetical protein